MAAVKAAALLLRPNSSVAAVAAITSRGVMRIRLIHHWLSGRRFASSSRP
jgi:hypothetical protein